jgi:hypothetical protein
VLLREWPEAVRTAREAVDRLVFNTASNEHARIRFAAPYLRNSLRNLPLVLEEANVEALFDAFADVPAVIVGAGPSLDRNVAHLARQRRGILLIATDTALRPLLAAGLAPDIVVAVDPGELNARHLEGLTVGASSFLVAEPAVAPSSLAAFKGRIFTFRVGTAHPWPWLRAHGMSPAVLSTWGSVATSAFDLALRAGCNPIAFAGMDLAYTGGRPYCRGTTWEADWSRFLGDETPTLEELWAADLARKPLVHHSSIGGGSVATTPTLLAFRDWLVGATSRRPDRTFVNVTGAGVLAGPAIHQVEGRALDVWLPATRHDDLGQRLASAWRRGRLDTPRRAACLGTVLDTAPGADDTQSSPWPAWARVVESTAETVDLWLELAQQVEPAARVTIEAAERLVEWLVTRRDFDRALAALDWLDGHRPMPRSRYLRGYCLQMSGKDPRAALDLYSDAAGDPKCRFWALAHRALILADMGDVDAAAVNLDAALAIVPRLSTPAATAIVDAVRSRMPRHNATATLTGDRA